MRRLLFLILLPALMIAGAASAAERADYTPAAMQAAQSAGRPVIIHVVASWCSTCAAQVPVVMTLLNEPKYKDLMLLIVDYDKQKQVLRTYDVRAQSTFIAFKGKREVGRSTGDTDKASIEALFDKAS